jgi:mannose-6-phosphate isomerase-like protein (cupin superfamily)
VDLRHLNEAQAFTTLDGSTIREAAGPASGNAENQSLAAATVPAGGETVEHYHRNSEEIYFFTSGSGRLRVGEQETDVGPAACAVIFPGVAHKLWNTGDESLRLLCCCSPAYSDEDTVMLEG